MQIRAAISPLFATKIGNGEWVSENAPGYCGALCPAAATKSKHDLPSLRRLAALPTSLVSSFSLLSSLSHSSPSLLFFPPYIYPSLCFPTFLLSNPSLSLTSHGKSLRTACSWLAPSVLNYASISFAISSFKHALLSLLRTLLLPHPTLSFPLFSSSAPFSPPMYFPSLNSLTKKQTFKETVYRKDQGSHYM